MSVCLSVGLSLSKMLSLSLTHTHTHSLSLSCALSLSFSLCDPVRNVVEESNARAGPVIRMADHRLPKQIKLRGAEQRPEPLEGPTSKSSTETT